MFTLQRMNVVRLVKSEREKNELLKKGFTLIEEVVKAKIEEVEEVVKTEIEEVENKTKSKASK
ncbi:hypothetical protein [Clostridium sp.]|uniref:hypothetical protein n=1 Tax=Clostridium sp. TaxID=1506 RepID=UPI00262CA659|nr:hypothetical protein [Clostridium sp.]